VALLQHRQDNAEGRLRGIILAVLAVLVWPLLSCASHGSGGGDAGALATGSADLATARAIASGRAPLPLRAEALALAQSIETRATREGAGARAVELHAAAAGVLERAWRIEGKEQDAREAVELYRAAAREVSVPGACEAALAVARLAGDVARDASTTYAELYRAQRRFAVVPTAGTDAGTASHCRHDLEDGLSTLVAFRPPQRVIEAIDEGLAGEGAVDQALSAMDAGVTVRSVAVKPPQLVRIESWPGKDATRIVIVLDRPAPYRVGDEVLAGGAPRTFVDLDGVDLGPAPHDTPLTGVVDRVRAEGTSTGSRISLDLEGRAWRRVFYMHEPYRIVVDVARHPPGVQGRDARQIARVVLDPGHGGKDTGAVGPTGVKEKDVTLDVAHRVAPVLSAQGIQVVLTRDDDRFVSLEERTARANGFAADLFISIHANASESKGRRGIETYVLDTTRDEIAARVAARENATTQESSAELASILGGMRMADEAARSTRFAQLLQRASTSAVRGRFGDAVDGGVHTAGFYVLVGARMPSVLFETSYISNTTEEQRLGSDDYRQLLADAIANAVKAYREGR
jgi:N-acetylmuramoyl-L-alanine amidase